jgi:predicted metal-dependent enzyme (double-stranded beta helix superfamily)
MHVLDEFSKEFQNLIDMKLEWPEFLAKGREMVGALVSSPGWLNDTLAHLVLDEVLLQNQYHSGDPNDIVLYRSPIQSFSVRAFIWEPGRRYPIHDHGSWGILGVHLNQITETKYRRLDDGNRRGYAKVEQYCETVIEPGNVTHVLPFNDGLHKMEAVGGKAAMSIHVYGRALRKGYIQQFDHHHNAVHRVYPPHLHKKVLAMRVLCCIAEDWSEEVLKEAVKSSGPDYMTQEGHRALEILQNLKSKQ